MTTREVTGTQSTWAADLRAGLTAAILSIPDVMVSGVLAGASLLCGLCGLMIGKPVAALPTDSPLFLGESALRAWHEAHAWPREP